MRRALSIWFPMLPVEALRRRDRRRSRAEAAFTLLVERTGQRQLVGACCERAIVAGVRPGIPLGEARAMLPSEARIEPFTSERDRAVLRALALWAHRFSPAVALDAPDGLLMDVSGCGPVFGGEGSLLEALIAGAARLGFSARAAIAPTFACARALAHESPEPATIVPDAQAAGAITPLHVRALDLDDETIQALAELGITRIGQLMSLPRGTLPARFGERLLLRLDQALGHAIETIEPVRPAAPVRVERVFDGPTTQPEAIELATRGLVEALCERLTTLERGLRRLDVSLARIDLEPARLTLSVSRATRDPRHLWSLLHPRLERVHLGYGVEEIALVAAQTARLRYEQKEWERGGAGERETSGVEIERAVGELLDTLTNRFGPEGVRHAALVESHIPERAFRFEPVHGEHGARHRATEKDGKPSSALSAPLREVCTSALRPTLLFTRPIPAHVIALTPDGPVLSLSHQTGSSAVPHCRGPERISPEWWHGGPALPGGPALRAGTTRDYFQLQTSDHRWLWVYRDIETNRWFIHGAWA